MYFVTNKLWEVGKERRLTEVDKDGVKWDENYVPNKFKDDAPAADSQSVTIEWNNDAYTVEWVYDKASNSYLRNNGGEKHLDRNTKKQLSTKNVVVLFMSESRANDGYEGNQHMLYGTKGSGKASIFLDGKQIDGTWKKANRQSKTQLFDASGKEIAFNKGNVWFTLKATGSVITVQ